MKATRRVSDANTLITSKDRLPEGASTFAHEGMEHAQLGL